MSNILEFGKDFNFNELGPKHTSKQILKSYGVDVEKGRRDGNSVIGKTKSGKSIYEKHNSTVHQDFTKQEHLDAADLHERLQGQAHKRGNYALHSFHRNQAEEHNKFGHQAGEVKKAGLEYSEKENVEKGEGSHGGKVIGHTKSGKPIYENSKHPSHLKFTSEEHKEAASIHRAKANKHKENKAPHHFHNAASEYHEKLAEENKEVKKAEKSEANPGKDEVKSPTSRKQGVEGETDEPEELTEGKIGAAAKRMDDKNITQKATVEDNPFTTGKVEKGDQDDGDSVSLSEDLSPTKAKTILADGTIKGHKITDKQRKFFGAVAGGDKPFKKGIYKAEPDGSYKLALKEEENKKELKKAYDELELEYIEKAHKGEGAHGGKVIGHTKSGKPIYDHHSHSAHKDFTEHDHMDASQLHHAEGLKHPHSSKEAETHRFHRDEHLKLSKESAKKKK